MHNPRLGQVIHIPVTAAAQIKFYSTRTSSARHSPPLCCTIFILYWAHTTCDCSVVSRSRISHPRTPPASHQPACLAKPAAAQLLCCWFALTCPTHRTRRRPIEAGLTLYSIILFVSVHAISPDDSSDPSHHGPSTTKWLVMDLPTYHLLTPGGVSISSIVNRAVRGSNVEVTFLP